MTEPKPAVPEKCPSDGMEKPSGSRHGVLKERFGVEGRLDPDVQTFIEGLSNSRHQRPSQPPPCDVPMSQNTVPAISKVALSVKNLPKPAV